MNELSRGAAEWRTSRRPDGRRLVRWHQARQYVICDQESADPRSISLVTSLRVQVASAPLVRNQLLAVTHPADLDPNQPVWNIRGSFTQYQCAQFASMTTMNAYSHTHNCTATDLPEAAGLCYKSTFGEWHCVMSDPAHAAIGTRWNVLPRTGTEPRGWDQEVALPNGNAEESLEI